MSRPAASSRPSWIGPKPQEWQPKVPNMKQSVRIEYASPGLQPPVFLFTSLSDPQWTEIEMDSQKNDEGEHRFSKTFTADEGAYQYKFRLGPGDWWACDDTKPVVDDGTGNKNNLIIVQPQAQSQAAPSSPAQPKPPSQTVTPGQLSTEKKVVDGVEQSPLSLPPIKSESASPEADAAPVRIDWARSTTQDLALPETEAPPRNDSIQCIKADATQSKSSSQPRAAVATAPVPPSALFSRETLSPEDESTEDLEEDDESEYDVSPLLRHESFRPGHSEQTQAPLFRHETAALGEHHDEPERLAPMASAVFSPLKAPHHSAPQSTVAPEADPDDPSLEKFPTDQAGIIEQIHRTSTQLPEDETREDVNTGSPAVSAVSDTSMSPLISLPSVQEDREAELEELKKIDGVEANRELTQLQKLEQSGAADEGKTEQAHPAAPAILVSEAETRPAAPVTPPMTPTEAPEMTKDQAEEYVIPLTEQQRAQGTAMERQLADRPDGEHKEEATVLARGGGGRSFTDIVFLLLLHPLTWMLVASLGVAITAVRYLNLRSA